MPVLSPCSSGFGVTIIHKMIEPASMFPVTLYAYATGFAIGLSLIVAIGAQNAFVMRQGLMRSHVFAVALFCAVSDAVLIAIGVGGVSVLVAGFAARHSGLLFGLASLWLGFYGGLRLRDAIRGSGGISGDAHIRNGLGATLTMAALLTFGNPHVYLDTVVLIGTVSLQFSGVEKISFGLGAASASFVFFFGLAYGARLLAPLMARANAWRVLDAVIALIMFVLAVSMLRAGGYL